VTLLDGGTDAYMRSGDAHVMHNDGTLDVIRVGANQSQVYVRGVDRRGRRRKRMEEAPFAYARANREHLTDVARRLMTDRPARPVLVTAISEFVTPPTY
jgi:hypothetical protein